MTELRTARLLIRRARGDDLDALFAVLSHPEATRYWSTPPHADREQTRAWMADMLEPGPGREDFVVELDGRVIGKAGFWRLPEIGYILHPDVWGQGLAKEALTAILDHVVSATDTETFTADIDPRNTASIRLLEGLGFRRSGFAERTWNVGGEWCDSVYYALDAADWRARISLRATAPSS